MRRFETWFDQQQDGCWTLADITPEHGCAYRADLLRRQGLGANTVNRYLAGLRVFLEWAVGAGQLAANPLERVSGLPVRSPQPVWLEHSQQAQLVSALAHAVHHARTLAGGVLTPALVEFVREQAVVLTLLHTGVGLGELVGLAVTDVMLTESGGSLLVRPKGRAPAPRLLALNAEVRRALAAYLALRPRNQSERLFVSQRGALSARQVQRILRKWARAAGIPSELLTAQTLRHTFGRNLVRAGVPLDQVATLLGYANLNPLQRLASAQKADLQHAVESIVATARRRGSAGERC